MKNLLAALIVAALATVLAGCGAPGNGVDYNKEQVGAVTGGVAGAVLGGTVFHGSSQVVGVAAGAILGTLAGASIGRTMDEQDRVNAQSAYTQIKAGRINVGQQATWTNPRRGRTYIITPMRRYSRGKLECLKVKTRLVRPHLRDRVVVRTICRRPGHARWRRMR